MVKPGSLFLGTPVSSRKSGCGLLTQKGVWQPLTASQTLCLTHPRVGKTVPPNRFQKLGEGQGLCPSPDRGTQGPQGVHGPLVGWSPAADWRASDVAFGVFLHPADELVLWHDYLAADLQHREVRLVHQLVSAGWGHPQHLNRHFALRNSGNSS